MKQKSIKIKTLFNISYVIMLFSWMFESVLYIKEVIPIIRYLSYALAVIIILYNYKQFSLKKLFLNIILTIFVFISSIKSGTNIILSLWLFILACEKTEIDEIVKLDFYTKIVFVFIVITLHFLGFTEQKQFFTYLGESRNSLGFGNPNTFGYYMFSICADFIYLKSDKFNFFHLLILLLVSFFVVNISLSRTASYLIILLGIISYFSVKFKKIVYSKLFKRIMLMMFGILTIFSFYIAKTYNPSNDFYSKMNIMLSGRFINSYRYHEKYDVTLLGQNATLENYNGTVNLYLDNAYLKLLINNGLIVYILILYIYTRMIKKAYASKNNLLISIIFIYLLYGITENAMFWLTGNVFLLYAFCGGNALKVEHIEKGS